MDAALYSEFCRQCIDWYWQFGYQRQGKYALKPANWLDELYQVRSDLETVQDSLGAKRPSAAVWGPSQTGKSTSVSGYIDANLQMFGDVARDGSGGGLHWPGGTPAYFLFPYARAKEFQAGSIVFNPFNSGLDASACLSRFTLGSRDGHGNTFHVKDPQYPIEIRLVKPHEVWQSIARGYDSQCKGPRPKIPTPEGQPEPQRRPTRWDTEKFLALLNDRKQAPVAKGTQPDRKAFEHLQAFCDLIEDLFFAELERFRALNTDEKNPWATIRTQILDDDGDRRNALLYNLAAAEQFTSQVLWDGYALLTDYFRALRGMYERVMKLTQGKPLMASLEVAALFLDMDTYGYLLEATPTQDNKYHKRVYARKIVPQIAIETRGDYAICGALPSPNKLVRGGEDFGILQGLVWELVVPLNPDHLNDTPFKKALETTDYLDFPGVERGSGASYEQKCDLDLMSELRNTGRLDAAGAEDEATKNSAPIKFFTSILKRGKTSGIVSAYVKQLTIDAFNIFQDLDGDKPNGDQLVMGIKSWWKARAPEYYLNRQGPSPLPLNLMILWWAKFFLESQSFGDRKAMISPLGMIAQPDVSTTLAANYYAIPRGQMTPEVLAQLEEKADRLRREESFQKQFSLSISQASFQAMLTDRVTGGTDFFFNHLREQMLSVQAEGGARQALLEQKMRAAIDQCHQLMSRHEIYPNPKPRDTRREHLEAFRNQIEKAVEGQPERDLKRINYALRELLNVAYPDLKPFPTDTAEVGVGFVRTQLETWVSRQVDRAKGWLESAGSGPDLTVLGLRETERVYDVLNALTQSLTADELNDIASWLRGLLPHVSDLRTDMRRHLAIKLGNLLVYGDGGPKPVQKDEEDDEPYAQPHEPEPTGRSCRYYRYFIAPFSGPGGHLEFLMDRQIRPITRPDQPGDAEVLRLTRQCQLPFAPQPVA